MAVAQPQPVSFVSVCREQWPMVLQVSMELRHEHLREWNLERLVVLGLIA
jgi:hypothetical protein